MILAAFEDSFNTWMEYTRNISLVSNFSNYFWFITMILTIIGWWNMFVKAGEPGWAAIIPFYNVYVLFKISDIKKLFWLHLVTVIGTIVFVAVFVGYTLGTIFRTFTTGFSNVDSYAYDWARFFLVALAVMFVIWVLTFVLAIIRSIALAKVFNLSGAWAVGIFFFPYVFYMILGLSKNIYYKNRVPAFQGNNGQGGYNGYANPYQQGGYQQGGYQQNVYQQNAYQQNAYQQNPYAQNAQPQNDQTQYGQNPYGQNAAQNPYAQNSYAQNSYSAEDSFYGRNTQAQNPYGNASSQPSSNPQEQPQSPYMNPSSEEAWKSIYDDKTNNL